LYLIRFYPANPVNPFSPPQAMQLKSSSITRKSPLRQIRERKKELAQKALL
jgi:hypothetical protein